MTDADERAFLNAVLAAPDDDTPRLVFADWLDERAAGDDADRATFIRAQCQVEHLPPKGTEARALTKQAKALLKRHDATWAGPLRKVDGVRDYRFRRGFPDFIEMGATAFAQRAEQVFAAAPTVRAARFPDASNEVGRLARCKFVARLASVDLASMCSCGMCPIQNDVRALFASKHVGNLTRLNVAGNRIGADGVKQLAESKALQNLRELDLSFNPLGTDGLRELAAAPNLTHLTALALNDAALGTDETAGLVKASNLPALRHLSLAGNALDAESVRLLIAWPPFAQLESLDLRGGRLGATGAKLLAKLPPTVALKRLDVSAGRLSEPAKQALKKRFGKGVKV